VDAPGLWIARVNLPGEQAAAEPPGGEDAEGTAG
jgi:hypothetical protein